MKQAKIAQREKHIPVFHCPCGGVVETVNLFRRGKLQPMARCKKCNREARKPSDFYGLD